MKKKFIKVLMTLFALGLCTIASLAFIEHRRKAKQSELEEAKGREVFSQELENRARFLSIKLNDDINNYKGFKKLTIVGPDFSVAEHGAEAWGYFGNDTIYNRVGDFYLINFVSQAKLAGVSISNEKAKTLAGLALTVYTVDDKIYRIEALISEYNASFNELLHQVYGPALYDNGYNEISYQNTDELTWQSPSVKLITHGNAEVALVDGHVGGAPDKSRFVQYTYSPLLEKLQSLRIETESRRTQEAINQL